MAAKGLRPLACIMVKGLRLMHAWQWRERPVSRVLTVVHLKAYERQVVITTYLGLLLPWVFALVWLGFSVPDPVTKHSKQLSAICHTAWCTSATVPPLWPCYCSSVMTPLLLWPCYCSPIVTLLLFPCYDPATVLLLWPATFPPLWPHYRSLVMTPLLSLCYDTATVPVKTPLLFLCYYPSTIPLVITPLPYLLL